MGVKTAAMHPYNIYFYPRIMQTVLITGGTGLVGTRLTQILLEKGYAVRVLGRQPLTVDGQQSTVNSQRLAVNHFVWNIGTQTIDPAAITGTDYIVHLAGAGVADKGWTKSRKAEIVNSRTQSSALLVKALKEIPNNVKAVVSASAIGWYGPDKKDAVPFTEDAVHDTAFLGDTCYKWENSIQPVVSLNKRLVKLRTGIVLSNEGGALHEFKKPLKSGIAAILGNGSQVISWIHIDDLCRMLIYAIENEKLNGVYNAVAPMPVSNKTLTLSLAKLIRKSFYIPVYVPAFILKIVLGQMSIEVLKSATVSCDKIKKEGFTFLYPSIDSALGTLAISDKSE